MLVFESFDYAQRNFSIEFKVGHAYCKTSSGRLCESDLWEKYPPFPHLLLCCIVLCSYDASYTMGQELGCLHHHLHSYT
jgi:hypothetical protein